MLLPLNSSAGVFRVRSSVSGADTGLTRLAAKKIRYTNLEQPASVPSFLQKDFTSASLCCQRGIQNNWDARLFGGSVSLGSQEGESTRKMVPTVAACKGHTGIFETQEGVVNCWDEGGRGQERPHRGSDCKSNRERECSVSTKRTSDSPSGGHRSWKSSQLISPSF